MWTPDVGAPTLTVEAHRTEAARFLAQAEQFSKRDCDAAKDAVRQGAAHAHWADNSELMQQVCDRYD